eukprot:PLAT6494.1.p1 GENE.PLAT6494.1~~PLAT6494.1.p1  ORF type:complete len:348 (+),score=117.28 PLAT6494.1:75-1046(+)
MLSRRFLQPLRTPLARLLSGLSESDSEKLRQLRQQVEEDDKARRAHETDMMRNIAAVNSGELDGDGSISGAVVSTGPRMDSVRRFYKDVTVRPVTTAVIAGAEWEVALDGAVVRTPRRLPLQTRSRLLATAIAAEWAAQQDKLVFDLMPLMSLTSSSIELPRAAFSTLHKEVLRYLRTDGTAVWTAAGSAGATELMRREKAAWAPLHRWFEAEFDVTLHVSHGLAVPELDVETEQTVRAAVEALDAYELVALHSMTRASKSIVIAMALMRRGCSVADAVDAARVESDYQIKQWGEVAGGHDVDRSNLQVSLAAASSFLWLLNA